jgi:hypothetical protein
VLDHVCDPAHFFAQGANSFGSASDVEVLGTATTPAAAADQDQAACNPSGESTCRCQRPFRLSRSGRHCLSSGPGTRHRRLTGEHSVAGCVNWRRRSFRSGSGLVFRFHFRLRFFLFGCFRHPLFPSSSGIGHGHWIDCFI